MKMGFLITGIGIVLSFIAAVVPHFSGAYQLQAGVLLAQLAPYAVYAPAAFKLDDRAVEVAGVLLVMAHGGLVAIERFAQEGQYVDSTIYVMPLLAAAFLLPLLIRAARLPWPAK